jgi:hypothetical protein
MTTNISTAHPTKFRLVFPFLPFLGENEKGDALILYCSEVTLPDLSMEPDIIPNQMYDSKFATKNLSYGDMEVVYTIDEKFTNYKLLFEWMMYLKDPERFEVRNEKIDASLMIYTNNDNPTFKFNLKSIFPINLSGINFSKKTADTEDMENNVTFAMEYYLIEEV